jgi:hypothetical protein
MIFTLISMIYNQNWYMGDFLESLVWLSMEHFKNNYLIFKPNCFVFFLINISFSYQLFIYLFPTFPNNYLHFLRHYFSLSTNMDMKQNN